MIQGINSFTKNQKVEEKEKIKIQPVNMKKLINELCDYSRIYLKYNTNKNELKVISQIADSVPEYINSNETAVRQILRNLLSNALKFTHIGEVILECKMKQNFISKNTLELSVCDTSLGNREADIEKLRSPYKISTSCLKESEVGSGLGMSIIVDLVKEFNSKLSVKSKINEGTIFSFHLPFEEYHHEEICPQILNNYVDSDFSDSESSIFSDNETIHDLSLTHLSSENKELIVECVQTEGNLDIPYDLPLKNEIKISSHKTLLNLGKILSPLSETISIISEDVTPKSTNLNSVQQEFNELFRKNLRVLFIDDDITYTEMLSKNIVKVSKNFGFNLDYDLACDTIEALALIYKSIIQLQKYYDIIFIDENMPFFLGTEFVKFYKDILIKKGFYEVKFVQSISENIKENYEKYFYEIMSKPCKKTDIR
jgi:hypothetical protein